MLLSLFVEPSPPDSEDTAVPDLPPTGEGDSGQSTTAFILHGVEKPLQLPLGRVFLK